MNETSFFKTHLHTTMQDFLALPRDRAAAALRNRIPDLLYFLRQSAASASGPEPRRTVSWGKSLEGALMGGLGLQGADAQSLRDRIVTDGFFRSELDRDQNVYLGPFFTRVLTRSIPDVVFQPAGHREVELALAWARERKVGIVTRGAGSTAMGGAVPNDGGLLLELSRFDGIHIDDAGGIAVIGAGARFKTIHAKLAEHGLALPSYPSNLGGTLAGWFSAGGLGLNSFTHGPVQQQVRALSIVLPRGEHVRFHDDGRLDVLSPDHNRFTASDGAKWLEEHGYPALTLADFAQTEGQWGIILTLSMRVQPLPRMVPFFLETGTDADAMELAGWIAGRARAGAFAPANLKYLSAAHVAAVRAVRGDGERAARPAVYVDFETGAQGAAFTAAVATANVPSAQDDGEARRWFADRFRPQQTKRMGPGYLAAEILMPATQLCAFTERAAKLARRVGVHLETEAYYFGDGRVLALPGYLTRGPRRGFTWELVLAPVLLDLGLRRHQGTPYVLGRWQSPYFAFKYDKQARKRLLGYKKRVDPRHTLNPGVFYGPAFRITAMSGLFRSNFPGGIRTLRGLYGSPLSAWFFRAAIGARPHPDAVRPTARWNAAAEERDLEAQRVAADLQRWSAEELVHAARGCVNCGECNSVCPIFHDAKIRLPQMLTHMGEALASRSVAGGTPQMLLDLCMRCGNCQEVCQADIPHLPLYQALDQRAGAPDEARRERHAAVLSHLRHSERYTREFLGVRPGGYLQRTPASLPGEIRFVLFRAENDAGPADTCVHCGVCVPVCPTQANLEFDAPDDPRRIGTDLTRCIGCGTCVEVCPANLKNGGRTLRVMEAPNREFFEALAAFETGRGGNGR